MIALGSIVLVLRMTVVTAVVLAVVSVVLVRAVVLAITLVMVSAMVMVEGLGLAPLVPLAGTEECHYRHRQNRRNDCFHRHVYCCAPT